ILNPALNEAYDTVTDTWSEQAPMPTPRTTLAAGVLNGRLYALGGFQDCFGNGGVTTNESYDPGTDTWKTEAPMLTGRNSLGVASSGGTLYAVGGSGPGTAATANEAFTSTATDGATQWIPFGP